jgi:microcystin-dependent protein
MSDPFLGEIRMMAFDFPPKGWALCNGQLMSIGQNPALFSLLGTQFGGDGTATFGLPDLRGRVGVGMGPGAGLPPVQIGQQDGVETVTLQTSQVPAHTHEVFAVSDLAGTSDPAGALPAAKGRGGLAMFGPAGSKDTTLSPSAVSAGGAGQPHDNMQPYLVLNACIATVGLFPNRQ